MTAAPTKELRCPRCARGLLIPFDLESWDGLLACSYCGACGHLNPQTPRSEGVDSEAAVPQGGTDSKSHPRGGRRLVVGGLCKSGDHVLTERNLYISPKGVATCKDCRKSRRREP